MTLVLPTSDVTSDVDELKRRIIREWAALSHTVIDSAVKSGVSVYALMFVLEANILSTR